MSDHGDDDDILGTRGVRRARIVQPQPQPSMAIRFDELTTLDAPIGARSVVSIDCETRVPVIPHRFEYIGKPRTFALEGLYIGHTAQWGATGDVSISPEHFPPLGEKIITDEMRIAMELLERAGLRINESLLRHMLAGDEEMPVATRRAIAAGYLRNAGIPRRWMPGMRLTLRVRNLTTEDEPFEILLYSERITDARLPL